MTDFDKKNPPVLLYAHIDARDDENNSWTKESKVQSFGLILHNINHPHFGKLKFTKTDFNALGQPYLPRLTLAWRPGHSQPRWKNEHFLPTNILYFDVDKMQEEFKPVTQESLRALVDEATRAIITAFPRIRLIVRPSRSGTGAHAYALADRVMETKEEWFGALSWIAKQVKPKTGKMDDSPNILRQVMWEDDFDAPNPAFSNIDGGFISIPSKEELAKEIRVTPMRNGRADKHTDYHSVGNEDLLTDDAILRAEAANRWMSSELRKLRSEIFCYIDPTVPGIVRIGYTSEQSIKTYGCQPIRSPRVVSFASAGTNKKGKQKDAWLVRCRELGEEDAYKKIESILDTAHCLTISEEGLRQEEWWDGMEAEFFMGGTEETIPSSSPSPSPKKPTPNQPPPPPEDASPSDLEGSIAAHEFEDYYGVPLPFVLNEKQNPLILRGWRDAQRYHGKDKKSSLGYLLTEAIRRGDLWLGKDLFGGRIVAFGNGIPHGANQHALMEETIRIMVQGDFQDMFQHAAKQMNAPKSAQRAGYAIEIAEIRLAIQVIAEMNIFNPRRLELAQEASEWEKGDKESSYIPFVRDKMGGCFDVDDNAAANMLKTMLLYQRARMWTPCEEGVNCRFALLLRGPTQRGKSEMAKILAGGEERHTSGTALRNFRDEREVVEAQQGKTIYEVEESWERGTDPKTIIHHITRPSYEPRLAFQHSKDKYPCTGIFVVTMNPEIELPPDPALVGRLLAIHPKGIPDGMHDTMDLTGMEEIMPRLHAEASWLFQKYMREAHDIDLQDRRSLSSKKWNNNRFLEFVQEHSITREEITQIQTMQFGTITRDSCCAAVVSEEMLFAFAYSSHNRGYLNEKRLTDALRAWAGVQDRKEDGGDSIGEIEEDPAPFVEGLSGLVKKYHDDNYRNAARFLLRHYRWTKMTQTKVKVHHTEIANPYTLPDTQIQHCIQRVIEKARGLGEDVSYNDEGKMFHPQIWRKFA